MDSSDSGSSNEDLSLIERITDLNNNGIKFACASPPDYDCAFALHQEAAGLAQSNPELNPDYLAFSIANIGYARRRRGDPRKEVKGLLEDTFNTNIAFLSLLANADGSRRGGTTNKGPVLEE